MKFTKHGTTLKLKRYTRQSIFILVTQYSFNVVETWQHDHYRDWKQVVALST